MVVLIVSEVAAPQSPPRRPPSCHFSLPMGNRHTFTPTPAENTARALELRGAIQRLLAAVPPLPASDADGPPDVAAWDAFWAAGQALLDDVDELEITAPMLRESRLPKSVRRLALVPAPSFLPSHSDELTARCLGFLRRWKAVQAAEFDDSEPPPLAPASSSALPLGLPGAELLRAGRSHESLVSRLLGLARERVAEGGVDRGWLPAGGWATPGAAGGRVRVSMTLRDGQGDGEGSDGETLEREVALESDCPPLVPEVAR